MGIKLPALPKWMMERMYPIPTRPADSSELKNFGEALKTQTTTCSIVEDEPNLRKLTTKCRQIRIHTDSQLDGDGCDEPTWHLVVSMLVRSGHHEAALTFSKRSAKHNAHSEERIRQMKSDDESATYGSTRCTTFGCDETQIQRCHGFVRTDKETGEISNSPAAFLSKGSKRTLPDKIEEKAAVLSKQYALDGNNLCSVQTDKEGNRKDVPLANFFAWIEKDIIKDDGAERQRSYGIKGVVLHSKKLLPQIFVPASEFDSMKWLAMWGPEPNILPGNKVRDTVRHAIQTTAKATTQEQTFAHLGWVKIDGVWKYLHAQGAVGIPNVNVEIDPRLNNFFLPDSCGNPLEAMKASVELLDIAPHRVTLPLWGLVFLSPLCEWLRNVHLEPKFLVWLHGYTGSRKTTLAKLFLSHFGDLLEHPPASFKDTANSVEKRGFDAKDSLLLIDDYHPTDNPREAKTMTQLAQQILRGYGDRVGRGRMRQDTSLRPDYPPRGMAIATAEDVLSGGSSVARLFPVELKKSDIERELDKLSKAQMQAHKLSEAMVGYLEWLGQAMNQREDKRLTEVFYERRNEASRLNVHGRLVEATAWLYLGLSFGLEYAVSIGAIEESRRQHLLCESWELFLGTASEQGQQVTEVKATTRFLSIVAELLSNRTIYTDPVKPSPLGTIPKNSGTLVGWHDSDYFYFLPDVLYNTVCRFLAAQGTQFSITSQTLWKQLAEEGVTLTETSMENGRERRHNLSKKTILGDRTRKLCVRADVLREKDEEEPKIRKRPKPKRPKPEGDMFAPEVGGDAP